MASRGTTAGAVLVRQDSTEAVLGPLGPLGSWVRSLGLSHLFAVLSPDQDVICALVDGDTRWPPRSTQELGQDVVCTWEGGSVRSPEEAD